MIIPTRKDDGHGNKTATGSAGFLIDLDLAGCRGCAQPQKATRDGVVNQSGKNDAAGQCAT
jgi:hypothetical protein